MSHPLSLRIITLAFLFLASCESKVSNNASGEIERLEPELDQIIGKTAVIEVIADGLEWSEGPLWVDKHQMLLFSDIPKNTVYKWTEAGGKEIYLQPSGYTGQSERGGETGSNGLILDNNGSLLLAQHGDRRIARMNAPLTDPKPNYSSIADRYNGQKFNSPNDLVADSSGNIYFTDPPYGLEKNMDDPLKESTVQGVYKIKQDGTVILLIDSISRPNGIALANNGRTLIIANSDEKRKVWYAFDFINPDSVSNGRILHDATSINENGLPDGLKIDQRGNMFATGPGGVWIFNSAAKLIGKIKVKQPTSNCAFSADEKTLFITADDKVLRVRLRE